MMAVTSRRLTVEEFLDLPEEEPPIELVEGVVWQKVSPKGRHAVLQAELIKQLDRSGLPEKVARAFPELRSTFAGASVVPDVSVFRWKRIPLDSSGRIADDFLAPPDIAIEIVSPEQSATTLVRRCLWYVANGVQVALLVDPADETVLAFRPDQPTTAWQGSDPIDLHEVLPDFSLTVERLFASLWGE